MLQQQWSELPQEMTGRRKNAKKAEDDDVAIDVSFDAAEGDGGCDAEEPFCEACRKWFKSEQQLYVACACGCMCVCVCVCMCLCV